GSSWGTLAWERVPHAPPAVRARDGREPPIPVAEVSAAGATAGPTGVGELDRVLGGGLVPGSVTLVGGEPGMGKSTLVLQMLGRMADRGARCLLVTGEESRDQVRTRAERVGALAAGLLVVAETSLPDVVAHAEAVAPHVFAMDSIQTVVDPDLPGLPGSVTQVRECAYRLVQLAKQRDLATVLVGHVTKDGSLAGPRTLEHVVDTVLSFDGDRHHGMRMLRALKHRFGGTQELGLFEMTEHGLADVPDPSALFLADRRPDAPGSVIVPVLEGARPLLVEVQALVAPTQAPLPRRSAPGLDAGRVALLLAVLEQRGGIPVQRADVYASVAGGLRVTETGADLAVVLAVAGAQLERMVPADAIVVGEVGLGGEVRSVSQAGRRLAEAVRLGFRPVFGPASLPHQRGLENVAVADVAQAVKCALVPAPP